VVDRHEATRVVVGPAVAVAVATDPQPGDVDVVGDAEAVEEVEAKEMRVTNKVARATIARHGRGDRKPKAKTARK
jgi:hypothetical protein